MRRVVSVEEQLPVVVGVDDGPDGLQVVDVAATEAAYRGVPLVIVHAWPRRRAGFPRQRAVRPEPADGRHLLDLAKRRVRHALPQLRVRTELADESAAEALIQRSERACLLVMGHRDEAGSGHGWGSTAAYVAHHTRCPLLVSRGPYTPRGPVVVATSGRHTATVACAYEAASRAGCPVVAVHVSAPAQAGAENDLGKAGNRLAEPSINWSDSWREIALEQLPISEADVAYTLERASRRGRLLVAGRGRKGWFVELIYSVGSLLPGGRRLCPVLLVPPGWSGAGLAVWSRSPGTVAGSKPSTRTVPASRVR